MSKFENMTVNGGNNQFGNNNTQNNVTNNHHNHNNNVQGSNGDEIIPLGFGAVAGLAALIWWFFSHIDQVYYYLNILTISSAALSATALVLLIFRGETAKKDVLRFFGSVFIALGLFGLSMLSREHAPSDVIQLSQQTTFTDFWRGLNGYGKDLVLHNFTAAIAIALAAFFAHLASLRQFSYSAASPNGVGFWFRLYNAMSIFKMRVCLVVSSILSGLVWAALTGKLPGINA
ncbi:hypothetical protein [Saccharospirillum impatiens]|uniref:hypothetical protein n=1 Tax=Saccharospirillum impatiens TaxID=169438 RepID=UPI00048EBEF1|nr:hypothetical protein [Saccharospirillum impatiens]